MCLKAGRRYGSVAPERSYDPQTLRGVIAGELYEWGAGPLLEGKPGYLDAIARDAGVNADVLYRICERLQRLDQHGMAGGPAADRVRHALIRLVEQLKQQVENASLRQLDGYVRARTTWSES